MGYERNDRRYGYSGNRGQGGYGSDRDRSYGYDRDGDRSRSYGDYGNYGGGSNYRDYRGERFNDRNERWQGDRSDYGRNPSGYDYQDRGFFDRAGDEVRSWFGDDDAERRRRLDERYDDTYGSSDSDDRGRARWNQGSDQGGGFRSRHEHDPHYRTWRDRQLAALDNDYDEYRRENQSRFDTEFGSWRQTREGQRGLLKKVQEHQEVVGSDGQHIGTVDHVRGDRLLLTKSDQAAGGRHHSIPSAWIQSVDDKVTVSKTAEQAKQHWRDEERNSSGGGLFEGDNDRSTNLNRSFSGTY